MDFISADRCLFQTCWRISLLAALFVTNFGTSGLQAQLLPPGITLPVRLVHSLNSDRDRPEKTFVVKITQDVSLPDNRKLPRGTKLLGHIVAAQGPEARDYISHLTLRFDKLVYRSGEEAPITLGLRAMASAFEVLDTGTPTNADDNSASWTTRQIGRDVVYRGGGPVTTSWGEVVGKRVNDGVMVRLVAPRDEALPKGLHCGSSDVPHALGVFASTACGIYGFSRLIIEHDGFDEPKGQISLVSSSKAVKIAGGSQFLLKVLPAGPTTVPR